MVMDPTEGWCERKGGGCVTERVRLRVRLRVCVRAVEISGFGLGRVVAVMGCGVMNGVFRYITLTL